MQSEQQQRIMGYFIEEAKDHLNTIEQGLLNLQGTIEDSDLVNEVFRAAHSVKGGAAMLGLDSIQKTAHRLEDYFKVLKECPVQVDQKLESLFLRVFDTLQDLIEQLQGPFGLIDDNASQIMGDVEPVLVELNTHLSTLVEQSGLVPPEEVDLSQKVAPTTSPALQTTSSSPTKSEDSALTLYFQSDVPAQLRTMLQLFKQSDTQSVRQQLEEICSELAQAGESFDLPPNWSELATFAQRAIANPDNEFRNLAPALIKDFKQAQDLVLSGRASEIMPSSALQELQPITSVLEEEDSVSSSEELFADMADFFDIGVDDPIDSVPGQTSDTLDDDFLNLDELDSSDDDSQGGFDLFGEETSSPDLVASEDNDFLSALSDNTDSNTTTTDQADSHAVNSDDPDLNSNVFDGAPSKAINPRQGPHVGTAELNSLADLFENEAPALGMDWQDEVIDDSSDLLVDGLALDASNDFSDLLFDDKEANSSSIHQGTDNISDLLNGAENDALESSASDISLNDDFADLFDVGSSSSATPSDPSVDDDSLLGNYDSNSGELENLNDFFNGTDEDSNQAELEISSADIGNEPENTELPNHNDNESLDDDFDALFTQNLNDSVENLADPELQLADDSFLSGLIEDTSSQSDTEKGLFDDIDSLSSNQDENMGTDDLWDALLEPEADQTSSDSQILESTELENLAEQDNTNNFDNVLADNSPSALSTDQLDSSSLELGSSDQSDSSSLEVADLISSDDEFSNLLDGDEAEDHGSDLGDEGSATNSEFDVALDSSFGNVDNLSDLDLDNNWFDTSSTEADPAIDLYEEALSPASEIFEDSLNLSESLSGSDEITEPDDINSADNLLNQFANDNTTSEDDIDSLFLDTEPLEGGDEINADITEELPEGLLNKISEELIDDDSGIDIPSDLDTYDSESGLEALSEFDDFSIDNDLDSLQLEENSLLSNGENDRLSLGNDNALADELLSITSSDDSEDDVLNVSGLDTEHFFDQSDAKPDEASTSDPTFPLSHDSDLSGYDLGNQLDLENAAVDNSGLENLDLENLDLENLDLENLQDEYSEDVNTDNTSHGLTDGLLSEFSETLDSNEADEFNDLSGLLEDETPPSLTETNTTTEISTTLEASSDLEGFTELETLLSNDNADEEEGHENPSESLTTNAADDSFDDLEALLDTPSENDLDTGLDIAISSHPEHAEISDDDDFSDLEKLLEDADHKLGGTPTAKAARSSAKAPSRRTVRRGGGLADQTMRVSVKNLDNLNNLVGELVVNRNSLEQSQERLRQFLDNLLYQVQQLSDVGQRMRDLYERSLLESSLLSSRRSYQMANPGGGSVASATDSAHATGASFDALEMDRFTGFHTLSQEMIELIVRVREAASDIDFVIDESDQTTRMFRQVTNQLQEGLTRSRMVPFAQAASRLPRAVRDISIKCGKKAELIVEGKDTLIDKMILEQLYDPMTHLVNNAITHGIEKPEERQALNKPSVGKITIRVFHQGNQTIISVTDDGAGIDPDIVRTKATQRGLISPEESKTMSRLDVYDLLFHHGFSTRDQADDFAGRGVGMDVVRTSLSEIRGVVNIDSTVGQGTTFTIRLPLTLSISKALQCVSNRARIAFPMDGVEDMLDVPRDRIQNDDEGQPCIRWRDIMLPFRPLADLLKYNRIMGRGSVYGGNQEEDVVSVVVLRSAGNYLALQVDQVLGEQEIVIKQLEAPVPKPAGIAGATVLGDGRIMPIADVLELIDLSLGRIRKEAGSSLWEQEAARIASTDAVEAQSEPTVLIVDDSITVRELLSMTFNKVGYRVEQARDGQEAWEKLKSGLPCELVFCDIEMPRMDGLELLSRIQKDPNLRNLPIAMLTSRGADRHRQMAVQLGAKGYFTKPYLEEALLDAAERMLNGEVLISNS